MMKLLRRWYWRLPALLLAAAVLYVGYRAMHPPWADSPCWAKYQQVRVGMTANEAHAVLAAPANGGSGYWDEYGNGGQGGWREGEDQMEVRWFGHEVYLKMAVIQGYRFADPPLEPLEESWWTRWRARLGW